MPGRKNAATIEFAAIRHVRYVNGGQIRMGMTTKREMSIEKGRVSVITSHTTRGMRLSKGNRLQLLATVEYFMNGEQRSDLLRKTEAASVVTTGHGRKLSELKTPTKSPVCGKQQELRHCYGCGYGLRR